MKIHDSFLQDLIAKSKGEDTFEAHRYPITCVNFLSQVILFISDPTVVSELYTTKSQIWDKGGIVLDLTSILLGNSFLFSKADSVWKAKR